jgi:hypothetical protein
VENSVLAKDIALLIVGIVFGVLPWLSDRMGIEMAKPFYVIAGCLCILAMWWAFATLDWLNAIPLLTNKTISLSKGIVAVFAVAMLVLWSGKALFNDEPGKIRHIKSELRLQFVGEPRPPNQIFMENIYTWYTLWSPSAAITMEDANKKQFGQSIIVPENWNIFVIFDRPTTVSEVTVSFSNPGFPPYEVKQTTNRSAIVNVSGSIPAGFLEIYVKP